MMCKRSFLCPVALIFSVLVGCGGGPKFTGYIPPGGGNPPVPNITAISPDVVTAGGSSFTLTVSGNNFASNSTIELNATALSTMYVSQQELHATVSAGSISAAGTDTVIVSTPSLSASNSVNLTIQAGTGFSLSSIPIQANDMVVDSTTQQLYLSVLASNSTNANTITVLNPANSQFGISQSAGTNPDQLAISSDGSYLYAGIDGSASVQRFLLPSLSPDISIPIGSSSSAAPYYALAIAAAPSNPQTIAVLRGVANISPADQGGVVIYDDAVPRPTSIPGIEASPNAEIDTMQWGPTATQLYGAASNSTYDVYALSVNAGGVQIAQTYSGANANPPGTVSSIPSPQIHFDTSTGYLYSDNGAVINPSTGASVGTFGANGRMTIDDTLKIAYFIGQPVAQIGSQDYTLTTFNLTTFAPINSIIVPGVAGRPVKLLRWGSNGLAFLTNNNFSTPSTPIPGMGVYLVSGSFVTNP